MRELFVGEAIRRKREALGLTQEELCEGICDITTLSRVENGKAMPSYNNIKALLQRLGVPDNRYYALLSKHELVVENAINELRTCEIRYSRADAGEKEHERLRALEQLRRLEEAADPDDHVAQQCILSCRALLGTESSPYSPEERLSKQLEALRLTVPKFDLNKIDRYRYSMDECQIINQIARTYSQLGKERMALSIYKRLLDYVQKNDQELSHYTGHFVLIAYNYAITLGKCKYYAKAIKIAEEGRRLCVDRGHYQFLPGFLAILGETYYLLGESKKCRELCLQAHYLYQAINNKRDLRIVDADLKERFGIEFPETSEAE